MMDHPRPKIDRILVIHTAFLGDIILSTPFFSGLRQVFPHAEIHFLTNQAGMSLLSGNAWNIKINLFDKRGKDSGFLGLYKKIRELREFSPQVTFCLHRSFRSAFLARCVGAPVWGFQEASASFLFQNKVSRRKYLFEGQKNLSLLEAYLSIYDEKRDFSPFPSLAIDSDSMEKASSLLKGSGAYIVLAPSSVWATKRWPAEKYADLALLFARKKQIVSVLVGGGDGVDKLLASQVKKSFLEKCTPSERGLVPIDISGKTNLGVLKAVLCKAKLVVSNDSAPLHLSIAVGTPVHGIFGPTTKDLGFFPLAPEGKSSVSEVLNLDCRPCGLHGHKVCPKGHFRCMVEIGADEVFQRAERLLCL